MWTRTTEWVFRHTPRFRPPADLGEAQRRVECRSGQRLAVSGAPDVDVDVYRPRDDAPRPAVVWLHGGGFAVGGRGLVSDLATVIASRGFVVVSVGYSRAAEAAYPAPVRQATAVLGHLARAPERFGVDPRALALAGDSAGAQIAAQAAAVHTHPELAAAMGITPEIDPASLRAFVAYSGFFRLDGLPRLVRPFMRGLVDAYLGGDPAPDARAHADVARYVTTAFPATFLTVGNGDPLRGESYRLARTLAARGVDVETLFWRGRVPPLPHEYPLYMDTAAAGLARARTVAFLERTLCTGVSRPARRG